MSGDDTIPGDTFEMLWDCNFCRTPKLLGLTHRYCPVCGAPQNAEGRYFPPDDEKVPVKNHQYFGRDLVCEHCSTYNSRSNKHCRDCGAPLQTSKDAPLPTAENALAGLGGESQGKQHVGNAPARARSPTLRLVLLTVGLVLTSLLVFFFWKRDTAFEVVGHNWERKIDIERFGPVRESTWCDHLPSQARELGRHREVRSHEQVRDGESCSMRKIDQGDGTFREVKHCEPRYTTKPVYDVKCDYEINRWTKFRTAESSGQSLAAPQWPSIKLTTACGSVGCERQGAKNEAYAVKLRGPDGSLETCQVPQEQWASASLGRTYVAKVRVIGGGVDCDSLAAE
jgi:hypothetical protein